MASADSKQVYSEIYYLQQGANVSLSAEAIYTWYIVNIVVGFLN